MTGELISRMNHMSAQDNTILMMDMSEDDEISEISDRSIIGLQLFKLWLDDAV